VLAHGARHDDLVPHLHLHYPLTPVRGAQVFSSRNPISAAPLAAAAS
jgi:hypothetical protein